MEFLYEESGAFSLWCLKVFLGSLVTVFEQLQSYKANIQNNWNFFFSANQTSLFLPLCNFFLTTFNTSVILKWPDFLCFKINCAKPVCVRKNLEQSTPDYRVIPLF